MSEREPTEGAPDDLNRPAVGRHRAESTRGLGRRLLAPLTAVAVVVAVIVVLVAVRGHSSGSGPGAGVISAPTSSPTVAVTPSRSVRTTPTTTAVRTHPAPTPPLRPTRPPASRTAMAAVRVYNSTHITGLAHHVAAEVAQRGWTVPAVGNVSNAVSVTTLYYSPSTHAAARHLAREFSGVRRLQPNSALGINYHGLTLVLTADWHD